MIILAVTGVISFKGGIIPNTDPYIIKNIKFEKLKKIYNEHLKNISNLTPEESEQLTNTLKPHCGSFDFPYIEKMIDTRKSIKDKFSRSFELQKLEFFAKSCLGPR